MDQFTQTDFICKPVLRMRYRQTSNFTGELIDDPQAQFQDEHKECGLHPSCLFPPSLLPRQKDYAEQYGGEQEFNMVNRYFEEYEQKRDELHMNMTLDNWWNCGNHKTTNTYKPSRFSPLHTGSMTYQTSWIYYSCLIRWQRGRDYHRRTTHAYRIGYPEEPSYWDFHRFNQSLETTPLNQWRDIL